MHPIDVVITSDFICPWCWIGHRNLVEGIALAGLPAGAVEVRMAPYELNPDLPCGEFNRQSYRTVEVGSLARPPALDAPVIAAERQAQVGSHGERGFVTPNTRLAHRLMFWAQAQGDGQRVQGLPEAIFSAYFAQGRDIGAVEVLVAIAAASGYRAESVRSALRSNLGGREVAAAERQAQVDGVASVPMIRVGGRLTRGAQPATALARVLHAAAESRLQAVPST